MGLLQIPDSSLSPIHNELNYGVLEVDLVSNEQTAFTGFIKDKNGQILEQHSLTPTDISFNQRNTRFPKICEARWANQHYFRMLQHLSQEALIWPYNCFAYRRLFICILPTISLAVAGVIRLARLFITRR